MATQVKKSILFLIFSILIIWYLAGLIDKKSQSIFDKKVRIATQSSFLADHKKIKPYLDKIQSVDFSPTDFNTKAEGGLGKFIKVVSDLEKSSNFIKINSLDINGSDIIDDAKMVLKGTLYAK